MAKPSFKFLGAALGALLLVAGTAAQTAHRVSRQPTPGPSVTGAPASPAPAPSPVPSPTIGTATYPTVGDYLTDYGGRALYMFESDTSNKSNCTGDCTKTWPPFATTGTQPAKASGNAQQSLCGPPITRADGQNQCVYNNYPLYYFSGDITAGDTNGYCLTSFGGKWHLLKPDGTPIPCTSASPTPPSGGGGGGGGYAPPPPSGGGSYPPPSGGGYSSCGNYNVCGWTPGWRCMDPSPYLSQCRPECCWNAGDSSCKGSNSCGGGYGGGGGGGGGNSCGSYEVCGWTPGWHCYSNSNSSPSVGYRPECCYNAGDSSCRGYG